MDFNQAGFDANTPNNVKFDWDAEVQNTLNRNNGFINICYEALDRHLETRHGDKVALKFLPPDWSIYNNNVQNITYESLIRQSCQFANMLLSKGFKKGDKVFILLPRSVELFVVFFGTLRVGGVCSVLFSAFGPEPIKTRLNLGEAQFLVTQASYYWKKVDPIRQNLKTLKTLIVVDDEGKGLEKIPDMVPYFSELIKASSALFIEKTNPDDPALIHFTSGTTGTPKGALHNHAAVVYHKTSGKWALNFRDKDLFWCTADPGWVTGISYGIISPLCYGLTLVLDFSDFNVERWYSIIQFFQVNIWYTAPTALRMIMKAGSDFAQKYNFSSIRFAASVGEPLNPEIIYWCRKNLKIEMHDNYWQTETGGIVICNYQGIKIKPGSMGKPIPGIQVRLIEENIDGTRKFITKCYFTGELVIKAGWPSMFCDYLGNTDRYKKCFDAEWYMTGDLAYVDEEGYYWFVGRKDDIIKTGGHLVGPFEVENVLLEHPAVLESAVIGKPDPIMGEIVKAFISLKSKDKSDEKTKNEIMAFARKRLGAVIAPKEIAFVDEIPKTKSGKVMRRLLRARDLGLPEGDISTMERLP